MVTPVFWKSPTNHSRLLPRTSTKGLPIVIRRCTCAGALIVIVGSLLNLTSSGPASLPPVNDPLVPLANDAPTDGHNPEEASSIWSLLLSWGVKVCFSAAVVSIALALKRQTKSWMPICAVLSAVILAARFYILSFKDSDASSTGVVVFVEWTYRFGLGMLFIIILVLLRRFLKKMGVVQHVQPFGGGVRPGLARTGSGSDSEGMAVTAAANTSIRKGPSPYLMFCFAVWYYGNYQHNICNKLALNGTGGAAGFPFTIATCQLAVGVAYAAFLWIAPDARKKPKITFSDWRATLPVSFVTAGAHAGSVFALSAGALSFGQIVKACEPAFAASVGTFFYSANVSQARWMCLVPIIGGVCLSSLAELDFTWPCLGAASMANLFAAFRGAENKKLLASDGTSDRMGTVGNQYAITTINAFLFILPLTFYREGHKLQDFVQMCRSDPTLFNNVLLSGWWFYIYNEVATKIIKKTSPVTQSIANTAKRAIIIVLGAMVLGESLNMLKLVGCAIAIAGVCLYGEIDKLVEKFSS